VGLATKSGAAEQDFWVALISARVTAMEGNERSIAG
jgi:hypothetical protein